MSYSAQELAERGRPLTQDQLDEMEWKRQGLLKVALSGLSSERSAAMVQDLVLQQLQARMDQNQWVSICGARRASKTTYLVYDCLIEGEERPGHYTIIGAPTKEWLAQNYWDEKAGSSLQTIAKRYRLEVAFTENKLSWTHPNGSGGVLIGQKDQKAIEVMMGGEANRYVLDEMHRQSTALYRYALQKIITPQAVSRRAKVIVAGNPGDVCAGDFWKATDPGPEARKAGGTCTPFDQMDDLPPEQRAAAWSFHHMTMQANTAAPWQWADALAQKLRYGWADDDPNWVQQYLGLWVYNPDNLRFQYTGASTPGTVTTDLFSLGVWLGKERAYLVLVAYDLDKGRMDLVWEKSCAGTPGAVVKALKTAPAGPIGPAWMGLGSEDPMSDVMFGWFLQSGVAFSRYRKSENASYLSLVNGAFEAGRLNIPRGTETATQLSEAPRGGSTVGFEYTQALAVAVGQLPAPPVEVVEPASPTAPGYLTPPYLPHPTQHDEDEGPGRTWGNLFRSPR